MIIIKFGGSVITNKAKKGRYNSTITKQLLDELRDFYDRRKTISPRKKTSNKKARKAMGKGNKDYDFILVHGAGSFGHISAQKYHLAEGYQDKEQLLGLSEVHGDVRNLNLKFMNDLLSFGFPGISIPPVAILINRGKLISFMDAEIFQRVLDINCIPVTFGDVVPDDTLGFSICSGDSIIQKLAEIYKPSKVIFLSDVDGLYTSNPVLDSRAKLIPNLTEKSFSSACTSENVNPDVTGGIYLKAKIALNMSKAGVETYIINGRVSGRLTGALRGDKVTGTMA